MAATYKGLLTNNGKALIASATTSNKINYSHLAVGDGNGSVPTPLETRTALVNEKARIALNVVEINPNNTNQIVCEAIIPTTTGGFYIRELGLYAGSTMVVNASYPPTYKPLADEGGAREIALKLVINIQNADVIALYLDDSLIYATREWVDTNYLRRNELVDNLTTSDATKPLTAKQGKALQDNKLNKSSSSVGVLTNDNRILKPTDLTLGLQTFFGTYSSDNSNQYCDFLTLNGYGDSTGGYKNAIVFHKKSTALYHFQSNYSDATWAVKKQIAYTDSNITGNAATATKLATARSIGGVSFDGTGNINLPGVNAAGNQDTIGNAATATKLETARTINGISFDGSSNINIHPFCEEILLNADLNTYKTPGFYKCLFNATAASLLNSPITKSFSLLVENNAGTKQTLTEYISGITFVRSEYQGAWGAWKELAYLNSSITGNAATATKLAATRTISFSGAATGSFTFDGSANASCILTLANSGVVAGTYSSTINIPSITVNDKGQITGISQQNIRSASVSQTGVVQLVDNLTTDDNSKALTAKQGKLLQDNKLDKTDYSIGVTTRDNRTLKPTDLTLGFQTFFGTYNSDNGDQYCDFLTLNGYVDSTGGYKNAIVFHKKSTALYHFQSSYSDATWTTKKQIAYTDSNITGNAATATKLATTRTISISGAAAGSASFDGSGNIAISTTGLGVGQIWQDLTASRSTSTTYTNSTGKPIQVAVTTNFSISYFYIDGNQVSVTGDGNNNITATHVFIIPNGSTYSFSGSLKKWWELR